MSSRDKTTIAGDQKTPSGNGGAVLTLQSASVGYQKHSPLLSDLNLTFQPGEVVVMVGPNGCGKSTLLKSMLGLIPLLKGDRWLLGQHNPDLTGLGGRVGYVPQRMALNPQVPITGHELLRLRRKALISDEADGLGENEKFERTLQTLEIGTDLLQKSLHEISGGWLQRVLVAYALLASPKLVAFDEVTEGVDFKAQESLFGLLKEMAERDQTTFILVSHDISAVSGYATRVLCLQGGIRYDGSPADRGFHSCLHTIYGEKSLIHDHRH